jgi:hypothetical protein
MKRNIKVLGWLLSALILIACNLGIKAAERAISPLPSPVITNSIPTPIPTDFTQQTPVPTMNPKSVLAITPTSTPASDTNNVNGICSQRITLEIDGVPMKIPYCRNYALGTGSEALERAVVVIHGASRTAGNYFNYVMNALAQVEGADTKTIILAPQFLIEEDIQSNKLGDEILYWSDGGWKRGDKSKTTDQNPRPVRISSFSVLDVILEKLSDREKFPNLVQIVIVGHSAGGQFVNRYAAGSHMPTVLSQRSNIQIRYIVANPSSYLYFNEVRRVDGSLDQFSVPNTADCPEYNEYKYGLEDLNNYMSTIGRQQLETQYGEREVIYLLGGEDIDPNSSQLDLSCAAMLQGSNRFERGIIYYNYLLQHFGYDITTRHKNVIIDGVGHSASDMFNSVCGIRYLFDDDPNGECGDPDD